MGINNTRPSSPPGLDGTYQASCIACLLGTHTVLGARGEAEWHIAFLCNLGVPEDEASVIISDATGSDRGRVPDGVFDVIYRVCRRCVAAASGRLVSPVPDSAAEIPSVVQPAALLFEPIN